VSRFHLVHAFTSEVGLPPHAYQIHLRIRRSRALLAAGMPLGGIAADLGFADQSHFGRHFRRVVGVTPGAYANATLTLRLTDRPLISPPTA
jgi:AraC-like DNA-binding protein